MDLAPRRALALVGPGPVALYGPAATAGIGFLEVDAARLSTRGQCSTIMLLHAQTGGEEKDQRRTKASAGTPDPPPQNLPPPFPLFLVSNWLPILTRKLHQQFESYKDQVKKMGEETKETQELKSEAPTCGICHKTKFADGCGHLCSYCQTKFCARCGGRVSLRSNKIGSTLKVLFHQEIVERMSGGDVIELK
ncbi:Regulating synaptic membrane exocytosis protein 1 [Liparis tanakae]|uniref:Regulating synaptic membrane exocytosis protein 1 n=1 Tax=Liparis tanakae TaxID=230148 RepID=A0A4Z2HG45_9TELE|nr:Regulating synaptic membrane exocytosis protein 1 [Liparis tanakae]